MRTAIGLVNVVFMFAPMVGLLAQNVQQPMGSTSQNSISVRSNLVIVPAFVKTKHGENVFSLDLTDFQVADDGTPQRIRLEPDADEQPLALVIVVQTGGQGTAHLPDYRNLGTVLEAIIGAVPHVVSVVSFDSQAHLEAPFDGDSDKAAQALTTLDPGDEGAAILDGLTFATAQLAKQPIWYRRAILLLSETIDTRSEASIDEALRAVDHTNTAIYSFAFSSTKAALKHEEAKLPNPFSPTKYSKRPYDSDGCMSRKLGADPDAHGSRSVQALDCAADLLPPLRLARMAYMAAEDGLHNNVPETVAKLTGGEYFPFKDAKSLRQQLISITNDVHNHYVLSFQPDAPHAGMHALSVTVKDRPDLVVKARNAYWLDSPVAP